MFHAPLLALCSLLCLTFAAQAGPREDADARTALELQLALQRVPKTQTVKPLPLPVPKPDYATAYAAALKAGKPIVVHVASFDCKDCCKECAESGACKVCQSAEMFGDKTPRMILARPSGGGFVFVREWTSPPTTAALKTALSGCAADCPNGSCAAGQCETCPNCAPATTRGISTFEAGGSCGAGGCSSGQCGQSSGGFGFRLFRR